MRTRPLRPDHAIEPSRLVERLRGLPTVPLPGTGDREVEQEPTVDHRVRTVLTRLRGDRLQQLAQLRGLRHRARRAYQRERSTPPSRSSRPCGLDRIRQPRAALHNVPPHRPVVRRADRQLERDVRRVKHPVGEQEAQVVVLVGDGVERPEHDRLRVIGPDPVDELLQRRARVHERRVALRARRDPRAAHCGSDPGCGNAHCACPETRPSSASR